LPKDARLQDAGWFRLVWTEIGSLARDLGAQAQVLWLPLLAVLFLTAMFLPGIARELPIAVVDDDRSATSRALVRALNASAGLHVARLDESVDDAWRAMQAREVYGALLVPRGLEQSVRRGPPEPVTFYVNTQFLLIGNMLQSEVQATVMEFSTKRSAGTLLARGVPMSQLTESLQPIPSRRSGVGNPYLNYLPFLVAAAVPCLLQIFMVLTGARLIGREFRIGAGSAWLRLAAVRPLAALTSRFAPAAFLYLALGAGFAVALFGLLGWPFQGSWMLYLAAHAALVVCSLGMGGLMAAASANYRLASSAGALYAAPALAFSGITFPHFAMPAFAQVWAHTIPVTYFLRLQVEQGLRGAPVSGSLAEFGALLGFAFGSVLLTVYFLGRKAGDPRCYGKL
jgi:ABC-2 type transport system permease protein